MYMSYWETVEFDMAALLCVTVVMPMSILLLRMQKSPLRLAAGAMLALAILYVGGFEHYRLHSNTTTLKYQIFGRKGMAAASKAARAFNVSFLDLGPRSPRPIVDSAGQVLPPYDREAAIGAGAGAGAGAGGNATSQHPLFLHLAHHQTGLTMYKRLIWAYATAEGAHWASGSLADYRPEHDLFQLEDPAPPAMFRFSGRPYRALFTVRDPRDMVTTGYFDHLVSRDVWAHESRTEYKGLSLWEMLQKVSKEEGLDLEIDRLNAEPRDEGSAQGFAPAVRAFAAAVADGSLPGAAATAAGSDIAFARWEDLMSQAPHSFAALGDWYGLRGSKLQSFVTAGMLAKQQLEEAEAGLNEHRVGVWDRHLSKANRKYLLYALGSLCQALGYEKDQSWAERDVAAIA